jgi:hypothetical protein
MAARLAEEEEMAQRIEERVRERVAAALDSEEVQKKIEARLREERTALEQKVAPCVMLSFDIASSFLPANHRRAQLHGGARNLGVRSAQLLSRRWLAGSCSIISRNLPTKHDTIMSQLSPLSPGLPGLCVCLLNVAIVVLEPWS